jgi:PhzF family phenazine biosynthesis protein
MLRAARELNLSETVFFRPAWHAADVRVRIFTKAGELPFAGHPVLGSAFVLGERVLVGGSAVIVARGEYRLSWPPNLTTRYVRRAGQQG